MRVGNTDATSYKSKTPEKCLKTAKKEKKRNYLNAYLKHRKNFNPFVASVDSLLGVEAEATFKRIDSQLEAKWKEPYSRTYRYVKSRVAITLIRAAQRCIPGGQGSVLSNQHETPTVGVQRRPTPP